MLDRLEAEFGRCDSVEAATEVSSHILDNEQYVEFVCNGNSGDRYFYLGDPKIPLAFGQLILALQQAEALVYGLACSQNENVQAALMNMISECQKLASLDVEAEFDRHRIVEKAYQDRLAAVRRQTA